MAKALLIALFWILPAAALEPVFAPNPPLNATNVLVSGKLSWAVKGTNLINNGGFESGNLTKWNGLNGTLFGWSNLRSYAGARSVLLSKTTCLTVFQEIVIPAAAGEITLSWAEKLEHPVRSSVYRDWAFRAEIWDAKNVLLRRVYATPPNSLAITNNWTAHSASMNEFAGQRVRVAFTMDATIDGAVGFLDDVEVNFSPRTTTHEVILGTDPQLSNATTQQVSQPFLDYANLTPAANYFWKVISRHETNESQSPVWSFATAPETNAVSLSIRMQNAPQAAYPMRFDVRRMLDFGAPTNLAPPIELAILTKTRAPSIAITWLQFNLNQLSFFNVGAKSISLTNWKAVLFDATTWPEPTLTYTFPSGVVSAGFGFSIKWRNVGPSKFPNFYITNSPAWGYSGSNALGAIMLLKPDETIADFIVFGSGAARQITNPQPVPIDQWRGPSVPITGSQIINRTGFADSDSASDWYQRVPSSVNFSMVLPFENGFELSALTSSNARFDESVWTGEISFPAAMTNILIVARDQAGAVGELLIPKIAPPHQVRLNLPLTITESAEPQPITGSAQISAPLSTNLVVQLNSSDPYFQPGGLEFLAGETNAVLTATLFPDLDFDWQRTAIISGAAGYLQVAPATLQVIDDELISITVVAPERVAETAKSFPIEIKVDHAYPKPVSIQLAISPAGVAMIPTFVELPANEFTARFEAQVQDDQAISDDRTVLITATINQFAGTGQTIVEDDEFPTRRLTFEIPNAVLAGTGPLTLKGVVKLNALSGGLVVALAHNAGDDLQMPTEVFIPPGEDSATFSFTIPGMPYRPARAYHVSASLPKLAPVTVPLEIRREEEAVYALGAFSQIFDPHSRLLVVSRPDENLLSWVNPENGEILHSLEVGRRPAEVVASGDGQYLFVILEQDMAVQRVHLPTRAADLLIPLKAVDDLKPTHVRVFPGTVDKIAVEYAKASTLAAVFYNSTNSISDTVPGAEIMISRGNMFLKTRGQFEEVFTVFRFQNGQFEGLGELPHDAFPGYPRQSPNGVIYDDNTFTPESYHEPLRSFYGAFPFLNAVGWDQNRIAYTRSGVTHVLRTDRFRSGEPADLVLSMASAPPSTFGAPWDVALTVSNAGPATATSPVLKIDFQSFSFIDGGRETVSRGIAYSSARFPTIITWFVGELAAGESAVCRLPLQAPSAIGPFRYRAVLDSSQPDPASAGLFVADHMDVVSPTSQDEYLLPFTGLYGPFAMAPDRRHLWFQGGSLDLATMRTEYAPPFEGGLLSGLAIAQNGAAIWVGAPKGALLRYSLPSREVTHRYLSSVGTMIVLPGDRERVVIATDGFPNALSSFMILTTNSWFAGPHAGYRLQAIDHERYAAYSPLNGIMEIYKVNEASVELLSSHPNLIAGQLFSYLDGYIYSANGKVFSLDGMVPQESFAGVLNGVHAVPLPGMDRMIIPVPGSLMIFELGSRRLVGNVPFEHAADVLQIHQAGEDRCVIVAGGSLFVLRSQFLQPVKFSSFARLENKIHLSFKTRAAKNYRIQSLDLIGSSWVDAFQVAGDGSEMSKSFDLLDSRAFFRLVLE